MKSDQSKVKFKKIRNYTFKGVNYKIVWKNKKFKGGHFGECTDPVDTKHEIRISPESTGDQKDLLSTVCDEIIHTHLFCIDNEDVDMLSNDLADFLYEMGWRLPVKDSVQNP